MQATQIDLIEMFPVNTTLIIPVYQRNYDWKKFHCEKLFEDIEKLVGNEELHFLGAIVYQDKKSTGMFKESIIVDGQQRISSLILLAKALYDSTNDEEIRHALSVNFFKNPIPNPKYKFKLQPTEFDINIFTKLMNSEIFSAEEKNSRLYENYALFKEKISKSAHSVKELHEAIYSLRFVRMVIENENPQQIFESLNSTGKDLTETEKIRNFLLMDLEPVAQENLYKNYWLKIELLLKTSDVLETFMVQYLVASRKSITDMQSGKHIHISKNNLYETFKKYFKENYGGDKAAQVEKFFADLHRNAEFYSHLLFDENTNFSELSAADKKFYELIFLAKSVSAPIILMYLNSCHERGDFDEKNFIAMVEALISLMFRAKVCKSTGIDTAQTAGNIINRFSQYESNADGFWRAITAGNGKFTFPSDEDFKQALMSTELNLSLKDTCKYLLYVLDGATDFKNYSAASVELVIPKTLTSAWKKYLRDKNDLQAEDYVNSLGNLVLTFDDKNKKSAFSEKRINYNSSGFTLTREVSKSGDWTSRQIRRRAESLADKAIAIWKFPKQYAHIDNSAENIFTLDSDFNQFKWTKLAVVSISNVEMNITNWSDFLREVVRQLYNFDKNVFKEAVIHSGKNYLFSTNPNKFKALFKIDEDYYMQMKPHISDCLKIIKSLVENFDRLSGTNFKDEIWFTITTKD